MKTLLTEGLSSETQTQLLTAGLMSSIGFGLTPGIAMAILATPSVALVMAAGSVLRVQGTLSAIAANATPSATR